MSFVGGLFCLRACDSTKIQRPDERSAPRHHTPSNGFPRGRIAIRRSHPTTAMLDLEPRQLRAEHRPLLQRFYRAQQSRTRIAPEAECWAIGSPIAAGLCLTPVEGGWWLTGLLVQPARRRQGLAPCIVAAALHDRPGPTWLFCHPDLGDFYRRLGFREADELPASLFTRLQRYRRHKRLMALMHEGNYRNS